jgi:hypothetical protein
MTEPAARCFLRCFACDDDGLVDEWPLPLDAAAVHALVPEAAGDPGLEQTHPVDAATAAKLLGREPGPYDEPVVFYVEPAVLAPSADDGDDAE